VTLTEQVALGAIVALLHESALMANSEAFAPASTTPLAPKLKLASPLFVTVIDWGGLDVLMIWLKVSLEVESVASAAGAVGLISNHACPI